MRRYLAIFKCRVTAQLQYRSAAAAGMLTTIFWGLIKALLLSALYAQSHASQPISLQQAITFIWLGQSVLPLLPWDVDEGVEESVKSGNVVYTLTQPLELYWLFFFRSLGLRLVPTLIRMTLLFTIAGLFFGLSAPISWGAGAAYLCSFFFAALLSSAITTAVMITLFWTISGEGIQRILPHLTLLFSGLLVPLPLFPEWMQPLLNAQPLRGILDIPCRLYTGVIPLHQAPWYFGFQLLWCGLFIILGRWLIHQAIRRIEIQGG